MDDVPQAARVIDAAVVGAVLAGAWRPDSDLHGDEHWRCVAASGLDLARLSPGSDATLVFLFGLLHDTRRENDSYDPAHGTRAAQYARELSAAGALPLASGPLDLLCEALELHSDGLVSDDATVAVCWDADRLHLPRVGIDPDPGLFSTEHARMPAPLAAAARLRTSPPEWAELLSLV